MKTKIEKILLQMCLMDDAFMTVALDGNTEAISHIISTVLQRKVNIVSVITQKTVHNTRGKKIVMDVFAMDDYGRRLYSSTWCMCSADCFRHHSLEELSCS